jgi:hypothetical protein
VIVGADCFIRGEVVMDSRGKGSIQLPETHEGWRRAINSDGE